MNNFQVQPQPTTMVNNSTTARAINDEDTIIHKS